MYFPEDMNFQYFFFDTYIGYFLQALPIALVAGAKTYSAVVEMMQREAKRNLCVEDFAKANYISTSYLKKLFDRYAGNYYIHIILDWRN